MLVGKQVFPVQNAQSEVLLQLCCQQVDSSAFLHWCNHDSCSQSFFCNVIALREVGVVLDFIYSHSQLGARLREGERTHDAGMDGLVEIILPPQMTGVIVAVIERWGFSMEESIASYLKRVAQEWDVHVYITIYGKGSGVNTRQSYFCYGIVVEGLAFLLAQLSAYAQHMLVVFFETAFHRWQFIVTEVVAGESLQACLCPFVETFKHGDGEGILHVPVLGLVVDGITGQSACIVIFVQIIVGWRLISFVNTAIVVKLYRVDEARYRNIFALVEKRVFGIFLLDGKQTVGCGFSVYGDAGAVVSDVLCG